MATETNSSTHVIQHLCLEAGRLMEDTSVALASTLSTEPDDRLACLDRLRQAADDIAALASAAEVLNRRGAGTI